MLQAKGRPCVLAGDFNFQPDSDCYQLLTAGEITAADPGFSPVVAASRNGRLALDQSFVSGVKCVWAASWCSELTSSTFS